MSGTDRPVVRAERPVPGTPAAYDFPAAERTRLANGLGLVVAPMAGRPLVSATLVVPRGAVDEPPASGGVTVLTARALTEGTARRNAIELVEAAERLGASLHAEAGWDATTIGVDVVASRLEPALELLVEVAAEPAFPAAEVERLRDERLNDILQARANPRRRADEAFAAAVYAADSPYSRPAGGRTETVSGLDRGTTAAAWASAFDPASMTHVVGGDVDVDLVRGIAERRLGGWTADAAATPAAVPGFAAAGDTRRVVVVHRPGSVQTEIRIGHPGLPRRNPDFHAVAVMSAILGGLFNSRLNMKLREEKGYTYGAGASFDMRRGPGPFSARAAVNTDATVPAVLDTLAELDRMRDAPPSDAELRAARDYLVGVFPLRFETPGPVVGALAGLAIHGLPDDELARYRPSIEAVTADDVARVAREHLRPDRAAVVLIGDADAMTADLEAAAIGPVTVERDDVVAGGDEGD
jgi:zinc protease